MQVDKSLQTGSTAMLILKLIDEKDMYGYQMIDVLAKRSDDTFLMKAGTLYPLLRNLEDKQLVESYEAEADTGRIRKYYRITKSGRKFLNDKLEEWDRFSSKVNKVIGGSAIVQG